MDLPAVFIIVFLVIVFLFSFFVTGTEYTIPMYVRSQFDDICNSYLATIEKNGVLTTSDKDNLTRELAAIDITVTNISAPTTIKWGSKATLIVEGTYEFKTTKPSDLSKETVTKTLRYKLSTAVLTLD